MLVIDPDDCGACEPERPVQAIYPDSALPAQWLAFASIDAAWLRGGDSATAAASLAQWKQTA
jgi:hypothetical protein